MMVKVNAMQISTSMMTQTQLVRGSKAYLIAVQNANSGGSK